MGKSLLAVIRHAFTRMRVAAIECETGAGDTVGTTSRVGDRWCVQPCTGQGHKRDV